MGSKRAGLEATTFLPLERKSNRGVTRHRSAFVRNMRFCSCLAVYMCSTKRLSCHGSHCQNIVDTYALPSKRSKGCRGLSETFSRDFLAHSKASQGRSKTFRSFASFALPGEVGPLQANQDRKTRPSPLERSGTDRPWGGCNRGVAASGPIRARRFADNDSQERPGAQP